MSDFALGLNAGELKLINYDDQWPLAFESEKSKIENLALAEVIAIHHIGSTAVPGLSAKPIVDIMLAVPAEHCESVSEALRSLDYAPGGYLYTKTSYLLFKTTSPQTHVVHLISPSCREFHEKLFFRDLLRSSDKDKAGYEYLKLKVSRRFPNDRKRYGELKAAFIQKRLLQMSEPLI